MAQSSTYSSATQRARTDLVLAARFELAAYVSVNKPDSRQNANPRPRHPDARRDETATLTAAALTALTEADPTCRVSSSGNNITHQTVKAYQPLRNRSWAPRRRDATPSKRYCQLDCSEFSNCNSIAFNSRKKYRSQGASKSTSHPKTMVCRLSHLSAMQ